MTKSIQQKLLRLRPPKVKITYSVETGDASEKRELPFIVGILADLGAANAPAFKERKFVDIDRDSFSDVMLKICPVMDLSEIACVLPGAKAGEKLSGTLSFTSIDHFAPFALVKSIPALNALYLERRRLRMQPNTDERVTAIDAAISAQLNQVMHAASFKKLEASWRGLYYLVTRTETNSMLRLRLLNLSRQELAEDFERSASFDESDLFRKVYQATYGTYGGEPYSLMVGDFLFGNSLSDLSLLSSVAQVAAAAHTPFLCGAAPSLLGIDQFSDLAKPKNLHKVFEGPKFEAFRDFQNSEDSQYVSLVVPTLMLRKAYGKDNSLTENFDFEEQMDQGKECLFGNAAYMLAERITNAFSLYAWPAAIRGIEGGGLVEQFPFWNTQDDSGAKKIVGPVSMHFTSIQEAQLNKLGFVVLSGRKGAGTAAFFVGCDTHKNKGTGTVSDVDAKDRAKLPYILSASRFAHYIKLIMRQRVGSFLTRGNVETYLNTWIANYVLLDDNASTEAKAAFPLRSAEIVVTEIPGSPGSYKAALFLQPHFQLEALTTSIRIVVDLPA